MAFKPNFTGVHRTGDTVVVSGASADPADDILDIRVILAQGHRIERAVVTVVGSAWNVEMPSAGFVPGAATAFGVETRHEDFTTVTWVQPVDIPAP